MININRENGRKIAELLAKVADGDTNQMTSDDFRLAKTISEIIGSEAGPAEPTSYAARVLLSGGSLNPPQYEEWARSSDSNAWEVLGWEQVGLVWNDLLDYVAKHNATIEIRENA